jgi:hypothetical protein
MKTKNEISAELKKSHPSLRLGSEEEGYIELEAADYEAKINEIINGSDLRNEKIFYETNKFFYVYPQKKFKEEDFFIESKVLDNNLFKDSFTQTDNNNNLLKEQLSSIRTLHNKMNILQQDMNHYFNTIQNNMNFLSYNIENNIYTLRKEQNFYYNILSNYFPIYNGSVNLNNNINEESNIFAENYKLDKGDDLIEKLRSQYKL